MAYSDYYAKNRERILQEAREYRALIKLLYHKQFQYAKKKDFKIYYIKPKLLLKEVQVNYDVSFD